MHKEEPQKPPEHTSEYVKPQNFLGACPQTPLTQSILWASLFVFALGPSHPLGAPALYHGIEVEQSMSSNVFGLTRALMMKGQ